MSAGKLRDRVAFERPNDTPDDYGNVSTGWTNVTTIWGDVREASGKEKVENGAVQSLRMATVRVRKTTTTSGLTEADRAVFRGQTWNIRSIAQIGRKGSMLDLLCEAGVAN